MMIPGGTQPTRRMHDTLTEARQPTQLSRAAHAQNKGLQHERVPPHSSKADWKTEIKPGSPAAWQLSPRVVELLVSELFDLACQGNLPRQTAERRPKCHIRQISMYLCRVVLSMPYQKIASGLGRDRTTVIHGCAVVEDRRDNAAYDAFVDRCERCVRAIFQSTAEENVHGAE